MAYKLIGKRVVDMKAQDGSQIKGYSLYFVEELSPKSGEGYSFVLSKGKQSSCFVTEDVYRGLGLSIGALYNLYFNQYGQIVRDSISPAVKK